MILEPVIFLPSLAENYMGPNEPEQKPRPLILQCAKCKCAWKPTDAHKHWSEQKTTKCPNDCYVSMYIML